ncbi:putative Zn-dependent peptidase [Thermovibrio guaymasensis]|uniref:Putative Zn-dependent peptidase n=1 Tax=Thermovibrio guaymasensis TaxID=240167 RepID=A0A420W9B4_9BACT|nr:pitrilysin family protein [Thermovibrio guaymasensis]RKQ63884.1 putative Zn-dependent peptidase [Thermovibrio guaymasensis]
MRKFVLKNGLRVYLKERRDLNSISVNVWVKAGASYEREDNRGVAHFLEHVLFNESSKYKRGEIDRIVEELGGEINAATSYDYTYYYINLPSSAGLRAVELLSQLVCHPVITDHSVEKEKPIVLEEISRSRDNPQELFAEKFMEELYERAPYRYPILGFPETVKTFTKETLTEFYKSLYRPERMSVVIVGNFDTGRALEEVEEHFGSFTAGGSLQPLNSPKEENLSSSGSFKLTHPAVSVPYVYLGWKLPPCSRDDVYYEILDSLLSSGRSSLLYRYLRERGLVYAAYSNYQNLLFGSNYTVLVITERVDEALKELRELLTHVLSISNDEFEFAKSKLLKGELFGRESGEAEADAIGFASTVIEDEGYYTQFFEDLKSADYSEFLKRVEFLKEEPLVGLLLPGTP